MVARQFDVVSPVTLISSTESHATAARLQAGQVVMLDESRRFGFVKNLDSGTESFFHLEDRGRAWSAGDRSDWPLVMTHGVGPAIKVGEILRYREDLHHPKGARAILWVPQAEYLTKKLGMEAERRTLDCYVPR